MLPIVSLKKRLNHNELLVQREEGYVETETFVFNRPASQKELSKLPGYVSKDIFLFLEQQNGAILFEHPINGGGIKLFSTNEIIEYMEIWSCPDFFIPIGVADDGEWLVCEHSKNSTENWMWIGEFLNFEDEFEKLPIDYAKWLDYLVVAQGAHFWTWIRK